jgi:hypothetical protein
MNLDENVEIMYSTLPFIQYPSIQNSHATSKHFEENIPSFL